MIYDIIDGYKVVHSIDKDKATDAIRFFLKFGIMCSDKKGKIKHAILTINKSLRIRFKYEGTKREYIEIRDSYRTSDRTHR